MNRRLEYLNLERPIAVIDLESTGLDPAADRVVEVALLKLFPGGDREWYHQRVNPGIPIPAAATAVHQIRDADVAASPPFAGVASELFQKLNGCDLAGFGITSFDLPLLAAEFIRVGRPFPVSSRRVIDVLALYRKLHPRTLASAVQEYLARGHPEAHSAVADVWATAEVLDRQIERHELPTTPAGLHAMLVEVDVAGKFRQDTDGNPLFAFGRHTGKSLAEVAASDRAYLSWMLSRPFLEDVHDLVRQALARR